MKKLIWDVINRTPLRRYFHRRDEFRRFARWTAEDDQRADFYRTLIPSGGLVFDVGANLGNRSKVFSRIGARVVAVEPQSDCCDLLRYFFRGDGRVVLVGKALGREEGRAEIHISAAHTISSMSPRWIEAVQESGRFSQYSWDRTEEVAVTTLDRLIADFGVPDFIKIDVEGFEDQVVAGLSRPVPMLSLEFTPERLEPVMAAVDHLSGLGPVEANYSLEESMVFALQEWVDADRIKGILAGLDRQVFGDIYIRSV